MKVVDKFEEADQLQTVPTKKGENKFNFFFLII